MFSPVPYGSVPPGKTIICLVSQARKLAGIVDAIFSPICPPVVIMFHELYPAMCAMPSLFLGRSPPQARLVPSAASCLSWVPFQSPFPESRTVFLGSWLDYRIPYSPGTPHPHPFAWEGGHTEVFGYEALSYPMPASLSGLALITPLPLISSQPNLF